MSENNYWSRLNHRRLSRRTLLGASARAGVGAAGIALVGCGDDDDDAAVAQVVEQAQAQVQAEQAQEQAAEQVAEEQAAQAEPEEQAEEQAMVSAITRGGDFRQSNPLATHDYFDPHRAVFGPTQNWMGYFMNYLINWKNKEDGILQGDIASLPEIPDEETYIFSIDRGARFWDRFPTEGGRLFTAEDARFNWERQIDAVDAEGNEDGTFLLSTGYRKTVSIDVIDEQTIKAKTDGPDATYLGGVHASPFAWMTSPEAAETFGDRWRDETTNFELSSGTGPSWPVAFDTDTQLLLDANPDYWVNAEDGLPLPYVDRFTQANFTDPTAVEAAYRAKQLDAGNFPLSKVQVEGIQDDFPDHNFNQVSFGFTIQARYNFNPEWPGEDGKGNPWVDRRVAFAFHTAIDRFLQGDAVYLGDFKVSALPEVPWFNGAWTIPQDELLTFPGYRPDREADIQLTRELLAASGVEPGTEFFLISPDIWEGTYPGIVETTKAMYEEATGMVLNIDLQPYTVILQRLVEGTEPGDIPSWTNPPADLDPTNGWVNGRVPGASANLYRYDYQPVTDIVSQMQTTLDMAERQAMAREVVLMMMGQHPDHGFGGFSPSIGVMNGIQRAVSWPYVHTPDDAFQFAHASHRAMPTWLDSTHPDYPA